VDKSELYIQTKGYSSALKRKVWIRFQDGSKKEEAESVPPKVKSWRDAGDTPYRQNH
jgi:hypothetical protein